MEYPIGHYIARKGEVHTLHSFDHPVAGMLVRNVETDKVMRRAFTFTPGDRLTFECKLGSESFREEWEVKVDISNLFTRRPQPNGSCKLVSYTLCGSLTISRP